MRDLAPQVLGVLARRTGDFGAAEDAVQEALLAAAQRWPADGVPDHPRAWLVRTAERRLVDRWRSEAARRDREVRAAREAVEARAEPLGPLGPLEPGTGGGDADDSLVLLFLCCHPVLTPASAIALTLRAVGGLTTAEIAAAFLVPEATMAQRISRAKARIAASGTRFELPTPDERDARLRSVQRVLYLIFNEGYAASAGTAPQRADLTAEAVRLARMLRGALPADPEVSGLLALLLLLDARRPARTDADGAPVPLAEQDRALWDRDLVAEGTGLLDAAIGTGAVGEYQLQAAIAALHDRASRAEDTDWPQILALYGLLETMTGNPVVTVNRALAAAMVDGPEAGLALLDAAADRLPDLHRVDAVRAHLLEMAGDVPGAVEHYRAAARRATNLAHQRDLMSRAARLTATPTREIDP
ncbi:RNA polymerase sigma factor [Cellulosimicrobium arenosum]|uniref:RNA polymerase sigma factor n=1 Tax=Cellulosimicrobium arenosum TaxID=2708133 RepID=UPI003BA9722E